MKTNRPVESFLHRSVFYHFGFLRLNFRCSLAGFECEKIFLRFSFPEQLLTGKGIDPEYKDAGLIPAK